jgi:phage shock protein A
MGIFSRLAQLIKSNLNDLISRSEDPEKMLNQVVLDMSNQLVEAKKQVAASIADEKRLAKQLEQESTSAQEWERRAMMALRAGNEALAKEALARKRESDELATTYRDQWNKQSTSVEQLKKALRLLNDKIEEAKRKKNVLIARKKRAEAQKAIQETMSGLNDQSAFATFDRMAEKVDQIEAEADAQTELADAFAGDELASQFSHLEQSHSADDDLVALKRKMGILPPEDSTSAATPQRGQRLGEKEPAPVPLVQARVETPARATPPAQSEEEVVAALEDLEAEQQQEEKRRAGR